MPRIPQKKRTARNAINFTIATDGIVHAMATGDAMVNLVNIKDRRYMEAVVDTAFQRADEAFNVEAEAFAKSGGGISHMYEWGTIGINDRKTNTRRNASDPTSRLWHTFRSGIGLEGRLTYAFKPSVANVPKPTKRETGMDPAVIARMKDHVFHWKAKVFEFGEMVTIKRKRGTKFLLIPNWYQHGSLRPNDVKRGYTLNEGPLRVKPYAFQNNFTSYWQAYWTGRGGKAVQESVEAMILSDFEPEFARKRGLPSGNPKPVGTFSPNVLIKNRSRKIQRNIAAKAQRRNGIA